MELPSRAASQAREETSRFDSCRGRTLIGSVLLVVVAVSALAPGWFTSEPAVVKIQATDHRAIQSAINRLPASGGKVIIVASEKPVAVGASIVIDRDNVTLEGEGRVELRLADGANKPVLILGQTRAMPNATRKNLHVRNLIINGNRTRQTSELDPANAELRNNGVSVRRVADSSVEGVTTFACRSGGLVTELGCKRIVVRELESYDNHFDGLACYYTEDSEFTALKLHDNLAAGVSLDIDFVGNKVSNSQLINNGTVGVFARDSRNNVFANLTIRSSVRHAIFLAQVDMDNSTPATGNLFANCLLADSGGAGIRVNDLSCRNNELRACRFENNAQGDVSEATAGLLKRDVGRVD